MVEKVDSYARRIRVKSLSAMGGDISRSEQSIPVRIPVTNLRKNPRVSTIDSFIIFRGTARINCLLSGGDFARVAFPAKHASQPQLIGYITGLVRKKT